MRKSYILLIWFQCDSKIDFFLNGAELALDLVILVNSENLINH